MQSLLRNPKARQALAQRLAFIPRHITLISALMSIFAFLLFLTWPLQTNRTYFSENALMPGNAHVEYGTSHITYARKWSQGMLKHDLHRTSADELGSGSINTSRREQAFLDAITVEMQQQGCDVEVYRGHEDQGRAVSYVHGVLRAPRGNGKESILIGAVVDSEDLMNRLPRHADRQFGTSTVDNAVLLMSLTSLFSRAQWQGHDLSLVVFLVRREEDKSGTRNSRNQERKRRKEDRTHLLQQVIQQQLLKSQSSLLREAVLLDFDGFDFEQLVLQTEGINGEMPNLDMVNTMVALANSEGLRVSLFDTPTEQFTGTLGALDTAIGTLQPQKRRRHTARGAAWYREISRYKAVDHDYPFEVLHLARSWWNQLIGIPTGAHGYFRSNYNIHAVTMSDSSNKIPSTDPAQRARNMMQVARVVESTVRSMNNLIESLHHSFFIYFLASPVKYHGFDDFFPQLFLFVLPFALQGFVLYYTSSRTHIGHSTIVFALSMASGWAIYFVPQLLDHVFSMTGKILKNRNHMLLSNEAFLAAWIAVIVLIVMVLFDVAYPLLADLQYRQWVTGIRSRHAAIAVQKEEHRSSILDWKSLKSLVLLFIGSIICVLTVTDSALSVILAVYLSVLSMLVGKLDFTESYFTRLARCIAMLMLSPLTLLLFVLVTTGLFQAHSIGGDGSVFIGGNLQEQLLHWISTLQSAGSGLVQSRDWLMSNSFYYYLCILCVPSYFVFLRLSWAHLRQFALFNRRRK